MVPSLPNNQDNAGDALGADQSSSDISSQDIQERLAESEERYRVLVDSIDIAFCLIQMIFDDDGQPNDYLFLEANPAFESHTGLFGAVGKTIRELVPNIDASWFKIYGEVAQTGQPLRFENHDPALARFFNVYAQRVGSQQRATVGIFFSDITAQKLSEERERVSAERERAHLNDIFASAPAFMTALSGPEHMYEMANRLYLQLIGHQGEDIIGKTVVEVLPEMVEQGFIGLLDHVYRTGQAHFASDMRVSFQADADGPLDEHFVNFTFQPLKDTDGSVTGILVHGVDLTDRKRLEKEREALLAQTSLKADREKLLNQIGSAIRGSLEPDVILRTAVELLGIGLNVDRCYFARYNQSRDIARASPEWLREGMEIKPLAGRNLQMSSYSVDQDDSYRAGATHVVDDVVAYAPENASALLDQNIRALLRVPIAVGDQMTALAVSMAFEARQWTQDEVQLVENVATLLHTALEAARIQQRERNIAVQLQDALQPAPPTDLPGLSLASYYRPALAEASVGGDFFDVFPDEDGCTALVVGDLSGKGLQAASQVAIVRNMLRFSVYSSKTLAEAVTGLHRALVRHDLLAGFATLFIGIYDENAQTLTYVNAGQEAGLLWRAATNEVEHLLPTGTVLGGFGDGDYTEEVVALSPGDVLALFTDGLTEVGPSRKVMLEIDGVSDVLRDCCSQTLPGTHSPQILVNSLIAGVDDFARGGARDDIALLVGVVGQKL